MSDTIILVVHMGGMSHVVVDPQPLECATDMRRAAEFLARPDVRWSRGRDKALVLAHNIDNAVKTRFGVREIFMGRGNGKKRRRDDDESCED